MDDENEMNKMHWMLALAASVVVHAAILGAWVAINSGDAAPSEAPSADEKAEGRSAEPSAPSASDAATPADDRAKTAPKENVAPAPAVRRADAGRARSASGSTPRTEERNIPKAESRPASAAARPSAASDDDTEIYVVKKGESLTKIATAHGLSLKEITRLNEKFLKKRPNGLWPGDGLRVPRVKR